MNAIRMKCNDGIFRKNVLAVAIAAIWLLPVAAVAQEDEAETVRDLTHVRSEIEVGAMNVSGDSSFKFGKYTGLDKKGTYGVLNVDIRQRGDSDSAAYTEISGSNLGLSSRDARVETGVQGNYKVFLEYDQIPALRSDSAKTIFYGVGGANLTLPGGWTAGTTTASMPQLLPSLKTVDIDTERKRVTVGAGKSLSDHWDFKTSYRQERKEGLKTLGAVIGNSGGNPRAVILPEPVDYVTDQFDAMLSYADDKKQFQFGYSMSLFKDENNSLTWQNPYAAIAGWDASAGYAAGGQGQMGLPPDNNFHQLSASGGFNFTDQTRLMADLAIGRMLQDETFLPYTVNPTLAASITQGLPASSLQGRIDTTLLNLTLASRPTPKFNWSTAWRYDDRDNKTPRKEYVYIGGDSQTQNTAATSDRRRFNEPYSYRENQVKVDLGYQITHRTDVTGGVERSKIERTYSEREETDERTFKLGLKSAFADSVSGGIRLSRADRTGSTYVGEHPFLSGYAPAYTATVAGGWENYPGLRKYMLADRVRDKVALFANVMPGERVNIGLSAAYLGDNYTNSDKGLTESNMNNYTLDATFIPSERMTLYAFYTYEYMRSDQDGRSFSGGAVKLTQAADPTRDWHAKHSDHVDTVGLGFKRTILKNRFDVGADYVYARTQGRVEVDTGSALTSAPLPLLKTQLGSISLYANYKMKTDTSLKVRYMIESYKSSDWAVDNVDANTLANVITLGEDSPDYTVHVISASLSHRF
ncbi:MAG: MtrB/PioB family decaheme-associated outer membrane protein [Sulfuricaulis sp.]|nr:MtrB/PioB family decaheme-associated outer membrane protein [Sulfuricaulis sp.]